MTEDDAAENEDQLENEDEPAEDEEDPEANKEENTNVPVGPLKAGKGKAKAAPAVKLPTSPLFAGPRKSLSSLFFFSLE